MLISPEQFIGFLSAALLITLSPGPDNLMVLSVGMSRGRRQGMAFGLGCALGCLSHTLLATLGVSALIKASPLAFGALKLVGGAYLIWLGIGALRSRGGARVEGAGLPDESLGRLFGKGLFANAVNPKVVLFFLSFLPQFIDPDRGAAWVQSLVLGSLFVVLGGITDSTWALVASAVRDTLLRGRAMPFIRRYVSGSIFVGLGIIAARAQRQTA